MSRQLLIAVAVAASASVGVAAAAEPSPCQEITPDAEYRCPYASFAADDQIIFSRGAAVFAAPLLASERAHAMVAAPPQWEVSKVSASPNHQRLLLGMHKPGCPPDTAGSQGLSCSFGRGTMWSVTRDPGNPKTLADDAWVLRNLAPTYGRNADAYEWSSWLSNRYALFTALIRPEGQLLYTTDQSSNTAQVYQMDFQSATTVRVQPWAKKQLYRATCLTGRVTGSAPSAQSTCVPGQRVVLTHRCYNETNTGASHAWWNTLAMDGGGGKCQSSLPSWEVPVLRTYVVELNAQCLPTQSIESVAPVRPPPTDPPCRHMGALPEWGDMQPTISADGQWAAFVGNRGFDDAPAEDNCEAFHYGGNGAPRVWYCRLGPDRRCTDVRQAPLPATFERAQEQPFYVQISTESGPQLWLLHTEINQLAPPGEPVNTIVGIPLTGIATESVAPVRVEGGGGAPL